MKSLELKDIQLLTEQQALNTFTWLSRDANKLSEADQLGEMGLFWRN